jgi:hypothetical protein
MKPTRPLWPMKSTRPLWPMKIESSVINKAYEVD